MDPTEIARLQQYMREKFALDNVNVRGPGQQRRFGRSLFRR